MCKLCGKLVVRWRLDGGVLPLYGVPQVRPESLMSNDTITTHRTNHRKRTGRDDRGYCTRRLSAVMVYLRPKHGRKIGKLQTVLIRLSLFRDHRRGSVRDSDRILYFLSGGTSRGDYTYGDGGGGGSGSFHTTRVSGGGFLATETATRYVPGHTPSSYSYDGAHRTGARRGTVINAPADVLTEYHAILTVFTDRGRQSRTTTRTT